MFFFETRCILLLFADVEKY